MTTSDLLPFLTTCPKIFGLLNHFYRTDPEQPPLEAHLLDPAELPEPYRRLLVHQSDMTSTLARYHEDEITLRVLERVLTPGSLSRHSVLVGRREGRPVEYGAIQISLDTLDEEARAKVIAGREPLGGILNARGIRYESCPGGFYRVRSNEVIDRVFALAGPQWLYGRCNCLTDLSGRTIAEVVEILPPEDGQPS